MEISYKICWECGKPATALRAVFVRRGQKFSDRSIEMCPVCRHRLKGKIKYAAHHRYRYHKDECAKKEF